jgi:glycosyl transferase family 87
VRLTTPQPDSSARPLAAEALVAGLLLASIHGFMGIPFMAPLGADLHNLYTFHQCAARNDPYLASGFACGDVARRDMYYPPALYWAFVWVRPLTAEAVTFIWTSVVAVGTFASLLAFAPAARWRGDGRLGLFAGLLLVGYPLLFALERANNDVLVLLCWAGALVAWRSGWPALSGAAIGLSAALKVYPAVGALPVAVGVVAAMVTRPEARREGLRFAAGGLAGAILPNLLLLGQFRTWATVKLPEFASITPAPSIFSHSLAGTMAPSSPWLLQAVLLLAWAAAAIRCWRDDPTLVLAGGLAASTSLAGVSFDYNLITALPLLIVQFQRATAGARWRPATDAALVAGLLAVAGHRLVVGVDLALVNGRVLLLWGWLVASGALAAWRPTPPEAAGAVSPAGAAEGQAA